MDRVMLLSILFAQQPPKIVEMISSPVWLPVNNPEYVVMLTAFMIGFAAWWFIRKRP